MKYYILRTNSVEENLKNTNGYNFKINNLNAERLISDAKDGDIFYLLYNISEKRFIEKGVISSVKSNLPSNKFKALFDSFDGFYQIQVLNSTVGYQEAVAAKSSLSSKMIIDSKSKIAEDYRNLVKEVLEEEAGD